MTTATDWSFDPQALVNWGPYQITRILILTNVFSVANVWVNIRGKETSTSKHLLYKIIFPPRKLFCRMAKEDLREEFSLTLKEMIK